MRAIRLLTSILVLLAFSDCQAQISINSAGLNAASFTGSTSISFGQTTYTMVESVDDLAKSAQGVQIPHEFYIIYCPEDINQDGMVDIQDFIAFNSMFGNSCATCREDINRDGSVNVSDFIQFNSAFGEICGEGL